MNAQDRQQAIASALMAALAGDPALALLVGSRIYDAPPARASMPSVVLRMVSALDASSADTEAQAFTFDLDVWDRYEIGADFARPRLVMGDIRRILHMQPLPVAGISVLTMRCTGSRGPFRDPDDIALHGIVSLAVLSGHENPLA